MKALIRSLDNYKPTGKILQLNASQYKNSSTRMLASPPGLEQWNPSLRSGGDGHPEHAVAGASHVELTDRKSYIYDPSNVMF